MESSEDWMHYFDCINMDQLLTLDPTTHELALSAPNEQSESLFAEQGIVDSCDTPNDDVKRFVLTWCFWNI